MTKKILLLLSFFFLTGFPTLVFSDCLDLSRSTRWYALDEQTIMFYSHNTPMAQVILQDCTVEPSSNIHLLNSYLCDGDTILVNGQSCPIMTVTSASGGTL